MKRLRCAIYTRKSSEEGLDQDFNSLDAQREACEAYIKSQAGGGWTAVKAHYDDGGISGGTLERPALQQLLNDIEAGRVNVVVVYKVDRLTRSLADFAKIVEVFDTHGVSFVSITQQFNTTSSMGRLTLNMLLSFAQFEREVTGERIRDKIAASKRKGMWMGGVVPLGYDVIDRKLIPNESEAETVRMLFKLYLEHGNVRFVKQNADRLGLKTKARKPNNGRRDGGALFTRGHIYKLLSNPLYIGEMTHKGERYPGEHQAIIDQDIWDAVQAQLERSAVTRRSGNVAREPSLLTGLLVDDEGRAMQPSHANKAGRRYRYYVTRDAIGQRAGDTPAWRLPARALEEAVIVGLSAFLKDRLRLSHAFTDHDLPATALERLLDKASGLGDRIDGAGPADRREIFRDLLRQVQVQQDCLLIEIDGQELRILLGLKRIAGGNSQAKRICLELPISLKKRGVEKKLVLTGMLEPIAKHSATLIAMLSQAHHWMDDLMSREAASARELSRRYKVDPGDVGKALGLAFLAPDIVEVILDGRQPVELTATRLRRLTNLPACWAEQRRLLGFG